MQVKHNNWAWQWENFDDDSLFLFKEWIAPYTLEDFRGKTVLDCGFGAGQHIGFVAPYAQKVTGIDLNTKDVASKKITGFENIELIEGDIATISLKERFDVVYSVGVLHHTDSPEASFKNISEFVKPGGTLIIWVYSWEGNFLNRTVVEFIKNILIHRLSRKAVSVLSNIITPLLYIPVYSLYLLPLPFLPYCRSLANFRKLSFRRNNLNVFDKLNAPQTAFLKKEEVERWFSNNEFDHIVIRPYKGVSWHASGEKR